MMNLAGNVGFIGAGNMAEALVRGMIDSGLAPDRILMADPNQERRGYLTDQLGVNTTTDNRAVMQRCDLIVLAIKPQTLGTVLPSLREHPCDALLVSILAGVTTAAIESGMGGKVRVVRAMPNTPALVGAGATALCAGQDATATDVELAQSLFSGSGCVKVVDENQMDAVTGLSGSGPAYIFAVIEALADGGVAQGLPRDTALELAKQTVLGAARLVQETGEDPAELKEKVCSPGGTTVAGMAALEAGGLRTTLMSAVAAATARSKELATS